MWRAIAPLVLAGCSQILGLHDLGEAPQFELSGSISESYLDGANKAQTTVPSGATVEFVRLADGETLASETTVGGNYSLTIPGVTDGYVHVTLPGNDIVETYQYLAKPLTTDFTQTLFMNTRPFIESLAAEAQASQGVSNGFVMFIVENDSLDRVPAVTVAAGATDTVTYTTSNGPDAAATETDGSGLAFIFDASSAPHSFTAAGNGTSVTRDGVDVIGGTFTVVPLVLPGS
ncbi:MAG TPA: hypothetical protein VGO00_16205 [Kofleriaceae bacterium]|nr:hypothetical protein [Kofleriaceae bacterium]